MTALIIGAVVGGIFALCIRPQKPLAASCAATSFLILQPLGMALLLPLPVLVAFSALAGFGTAIHVALLFTVFQQQIPPEAISRVTSYDTLAAYVPAPLGAAVAGPLAAAIGIPAALFTAGGVMVVTQAIIYAQPSVHAIRAPKLSAGEVKG